MSETCGDPNCTNNEHWPNGGCSAYLRRKRGMEVEIGVQSAAPRSLSAVKAHHLAHTIAIMGLPGVASALERAMQPKSGNQFTPCDKCDKQTRGVRCFKCSTRPAPGGDDERE